MGRLTKAKIDEIGKLRGQGYTQKETAEKAKVHLRTVRKYDPLKEKPGPTPEQVGGLEETCNELAAKGLVHEDSDGRVRISSLGKRVSVILEKLELKAGLKFVAEAGRPVAADEIHAYLDEMDDELFYEALDEARR